MMLSPKNIEELEEARCAAMINGDTEWMETAFSDDLLWIHASGIVDTKASLMEHFRSGDTLCYQLDRDDIVTRLFNDFAIVTGVVFMDAMYNATRKSARNRYQVVWARIGDKIQLAGLQSARLADR